MNENLDPTNENFSKEDLEIDKALRPLNFDDFNGQKKVLDNLKIFSCVPSFELSSINNIGILNFF